MPVYNIPIYGLIGSPDNGEDTAKYFSYNDLLTHLNSAKNFDTLNLDVASDGGYCDVADKMISAVEKTGKIITSSNSGNVASAASKFFTLAPVGSRIFYPAKGAFLIHNPYGAVEGDATELTARAKELQAIENDYAKWYAKATGADVDIIKAFMSENIPLTPEQISSLGFARVENQTIQAVAKLHLKINNNMENKEVVEKLNGFEKVLQGFLAKFKIKALMLSDVNGVEMDFPEITDITELTVGVKTSAPNGEYVMADGSTVKVDGGIVTEIVPPASGEIDALKAENEALKAELESIKASKVETEAMASEAVKAANEVKAEFVRFKAQFSDFAPPVNTGINTPQTQTSRKIFKS
jgi:ATP-dependent protease ClpP protease subunit